jgi:hypothetical protein
LHFPQDVTKAKFITKSLSSINDLCYTKNRNKSYNSSDIFIRHLKLILRVLMEVFLCWSHSENIKNMYLLLNVKFFKRLKNYSSITMLTKYWKQRILYLFYCKSLMFSENKCFEEVGRKQKIIFRLTLRGNKRRQKVKSFSDWYLL